MSMMIFFDFARSLSQDVVVPKGTIEKIRSHVERIVVNLGLERDERGKVQTMRPADWVSDEEFCSCAVMQSEFVPRLYRSLAVWSRRKIDGFEIITVGMSELMFSGLRTIKPPIRRWTNAYLDRMIEKFTDVMVCGKVDGIFFEADRLEPGDANRVGELMWRMIEARRETMRSGGISRDDHIEEMRSFYDVLRGRGDERDRVVIDERQAASVIWLLEEVAGMDEHGADLEVVAGQDYLSSGYYGEHVWCADCGGAMDPSAASVCGLKECPLWEEPEEE